MKCPACGAHIELALVSGTASQEPTPAGDNNGQRRRHGAEEWAAARRWCEDDGLDDAQIAQRLGVAMMTVRQRRYTEHWKPRRRLDGKPWTAEPPNAAAFPTTAVEEVVAPTTPLRRPVRTLPAPVQHSCGKWTTKDPCWNCQQPVEEVS